MFSVVLFCPRCCLCVPLFVLVRKMLCRPINKGRGRCVLLCCDVELEN